MTVPEQSIPPHVLRGLALVAESEGRLDAAIDAYQRAIRAAPGDVAAYVDLAALLGGQGRFQDALPVCRRAAALAPRSVATQLNLASTLTELRHLDEAAEHFACALALAPGDVRLMGDLAGCLLLAGRVPEAVALLRRAVVSAPADVAARSALLFALNFCVESGEELRAEHVLHGTRCVTQPVSVTSRRAAGGLPRTRGPRIRVGLVSGDLHRHSVAYFLAPLLDHYDRGRIHLTAYACGRVVDGVTSWLRARSDAWVEGYRLPDDELAHRVRRDGIDVLIDVGGHTSSGRPGLFALAPAPVQVGFLGYPTSTGIPTMDARISDRFVDPPDAARVGPERVLRVPDSYFCYRPPGDAPDVARRPRATAGVTFGSFNALPKITDRTLALWSQVLEAVPDARLLIKAQGLSDDSTRSRLTARCEAAGIQAQRLSLLDWQMDTASHLACYAHVDVALDTYPYNGATTTCESLWMGVPVVSLAGETHASRMGLSILSAAGRQEWATDDPQRFVAACVDLADDARRLEADRSARRSALAASPLMGEAAHVRAFERLIAECVNAG